jgi:glycosyltransferase involved in cell wall biosynthesis
MYILDLAHWKKGSKDTNLTHKLFLNPLQYISAIVSRKIITISEFSKKDIVQTLKIPAEKIAVIYLGIDSQKFTISSKENVQKVMTKFKITGDYIFSYSGILPHKNYLRLCEAFKKSELPVNLVISGKRTSHSEELIAKINELKMQARIQYIEYASDNDLVDLISGSLYYTNVSYFEGAGTTPLEAMLCKKAVLIGDVPSVREYVNNYGYYVDPLSIDSICDGLVDLYNNLDLRDKLQFDGYKWALKFDYKEYCKKLILILCN